MKARHWAEVGESTFVLGIWLLYWIHRLLGRWPFRVCLFPVVLVHWLARPVVRDASLQYLSRLETATGALGHPPRLRDSLRHMASFAETMLDKLLAVSGRYRFEQVRTEGREQFYEAAKGGRGGIIVTAHMGCLELCRAMAEKRGEVKLNILVHTRHAEQFNRMLKRLNPDSDFQLMEVTDLGPGTAVMLQERVAAGEFVVIAGDRVPVHASQTVSVDFLGHAAPFPVGPYVLASLFKCPLFLLGCIHEGPGYTIHFECLADRVDLPRSKRVEALTGYARHYAERLTALLERSPLDWFNFFPFWDQANVSARQQQ
ncbi:acyltransferase [Myxococcus sp. K15C18031901]|uniref:LpxL/LpxP family acyltransferase n=1 Tax=Myxococcus dinghuensis TaxID=2906761 RepID=UPI0020A78DC5|nr:acyltransferase [Myxococcus dinghuensis]MCP3102398.1 acyltransferase [Myxococcus dinghuensis]